jgi:GNAT superfamily N-acetyltransferase
MIFNNLHTLSVLIHPEHRGKGLGKFLMAKTEEYAKR